MTRGRKPPEMPLKRAIARGYEVALDDWRKGKIAKLGPAILKLAHDHGISLRTCYRILAQFGTK